MGRRHRGSSKAAADKAAAAAAAAAGGGGGGSTCVEVRGLIAEGTSYWLDASEAFLASRGLKVAREVVPESSARYRPWVAEDLLRASGVARTWARWRKACNASRGLEVAGWWRRFAEGYRRPVSVVVLAKRRGAARAIVANCKRCLAQFHSFDRASLRDALRDATATAQFIDDLLLPVYERLRSELLRDHATSGGTSGSALGRCSRTGARGRAGEDGAIAAPATSS